ncbi:phage recombination protein Bet [Nocardiopsis flavescens]|uniref:phage recombination protein Bet n=1 Tax=Nocardiopsis flavescens TaxID=758803 RepID=UPI00364E551B
MTAAAEEPTPVEPVDDALDVEATEPEQEPESDAIAAELTRFAGGLVVTPDQVEWSPAQLAALRQMGIEEAPFGEQMVFLHFCQRSGLDPFSKHVYLIGRRDQHAPSGKKWTIQVGIDGFRSSASGTGLYRGQVGPEWCGPDGVWRNIWINDAVLPVAARVGVLHAEMDVPVWGVAKMAEFRPQGGSGGDRAFLWRQMPAHMIAKCAEAQAIRKAFPSTLGGAYAPEEMDQASLEEAQQRRAQASSIIEAHNASRRRHHYERIDRARVDALYSLMREVGVQTPAAARHGVQTAVGRPVESMSDLTWAEADLVEKSLRQRPKPAFAETAPAEATPAGEPVDAEVVDDPAEVWRSLCQHVQAQDWDEEELTRFYSLHHQGRSPADATAAELRRFEAWFIAGAPGRVSNPFPAQPDREPPEDPWGDATPRGGGST